MGRLQDHVGRVLDYGELMARIPQQEPFRFVSEILEIKEDYVRGRYRWDPDSDFYRGHFPGDPVTPGVLLVESMAQCGVVPLAVYLTHLEMGDDEAAKFQTIFTEANVEFSGIVRPGDVVTTETRRVYWRRRKLKADVEMKLEDGTVVCSGQLAGIGVTL